MTPTLLIVDDESLVRRALRRALAQDGLEVEAVGSVAAARERLDRGGVDVMVLDHRLGDGTGMDVLAHSRERSPDTQVIVLTAHGSVALAVEALRAGADDFLQKDGDPRIARHAVDRALEGVRLRHRLAALEEERMSRRGLPRIVAESPAMQELLRRARRYAASDTTVLIEGETGTGKSLVAELLHQASERRDGPFVTINCGAIPRELIESELFGYAEGAFTGASRRGKVGLIERADGGTLFLDEIGDLGLDLQSKLLLVLESGEIVRVGAVEPVKVDVRFIAATNVDLDSRLAAGEFRWDLFYRLDVARLAVPPLRERPEDVVALARQFVADLDHKLGREVRGLTPEAEERLAAEPWPGNVRELRNTLERAMLGQPGDLLDVADLGLDGRHAGPGPRRDPRQVRVDLELGCGDNLLDASLRQTVEQAWEAADHNQSRAAELLGVPRTTLQHHLRKLSLI